MKDRARAPREDEDAALVTACKQGNMDAFAALVDRHGKRVYAVAYRITGDRCDAEEVAQEAFVNAWRGIKAFRGEARFATWLTTIAVNLSRNRLKRTTARRLREPVSIDDPVDTPNGRLARELPSGDPPVHERLERDAELAWLRDCVDALDPAFREVIVLRDMQGLAYQEIATILREREGTVKSRLFRAREAVKECLKKVMGELP
jgi:RNA polymerase sigma-70 factor (ECF subfamily)